MKKLSPGHSFNGCTIIRKSDKSRPRKTYWDCLCHCGKAFTSRDDTIKTKPPKSCGCLRGKITAERCRTHGLSSTKEYQVWRGMVDRCTKPTSTSYPRYGGKGIRVCSRWENSFEAFLEDMGTKPSPKHQLDRINNDGDYEPGNCRWTTAKINSRNRGSYNHKLTIDGQTKCISEWSEKSGIKPGTIWYRIKKGWSHKDAVYLPLQRKRKQ